MVEQVEIENFKSIRKLKIDLAGLNVFIGANGSGKSNILEGVALGAAAADNALEGISLVNRGIRLSEGYLMMNRLGGNFKKNQISVTFKGSDKELSYSINPPARTFSKWLSVSSLDMSLISKLVEEFRNDTDFLEKPLAEIMQQIRSEARVELEKTEVPLYENTKDFIIYSPENNELRKFEEEGQTQPLGIHGAGLFKLLKTMDNDQLNILKKNLKMIDWFKDFKVSEDPSTNQRRIQLQDRYIAEENQAFFDQRNANEGFLFLLFYMSLFVSQYTPKFFAIDNIDNALNPRLCRDLMLRFNTLSKEYNKQAIVTTHNPAILDGINLRDDNQRLYVVFRDLEGATKIKRVTEKMYNYDSDMLLSEAFSRGLIGGLNTSMAAW